MLSAIPLFVVAQVLRRSMQVDGTGVDLLVRVVTHQWWIPIQIAETVGLLLVVLGLVSLLRVLYTRVERLLVEASLVALGIVVVLDLVEFVIAAIASPRVLSASLESGLSEPELGIIAMGYSVLGVSLISFTQLFIGGSFLLVGLALYRGELYHWMFAVVAVAIGILTMLTVVTPLPLGLGGVMIIRALVLLWLTGMGITMATTSAPPQPALAGSDNTI